MKYVREKMRQEGLDPDDSINYEREEELKREFEPQVNKELAHSPLLKRDVLYRHITTCPICGKRSNGGYLEIYEHSPEASYESEEVKVEREEQPHKSISYLGLHMLKEHPERKDIEGLRDEWGIFYLDEWVDFLNRYYPELKGIASGV